MAVVLLLIAKFMRESLWSERPTQSSGERLIYRRTLADLPNLRLVSLSTTLRSLDCLPCAGCI